MTGRNENLDAIHEADEVQQKTKAALYRIRQQTAEAEEISEGTLEQMREQRHQMQRIQMDAEDFNTTLKKTKRLQDRFDRWAGNWSGTHKKIARAQANEQMQAAERARQRATIGKENKVPERNHASAAASKNSASSKKGSRARSKVVKRPPKRVDLVSSDLAHPDVAKLDDESRAGLENLANTDNEIDAMLDQTAESLDRLKEMSLAIREETQAQDKNIDKLTSTVDKVDSKQAFVNARARRHLGGRWRNRTEAV